MSDSRSTRALRLALVALCALAMALWGLPARAELRASSPIGITQDAGHGDHAVLRSDAGVDHARAPRAPRGPDPQDHLGGHFALSHSWASAFAVSRDENAVAAPSVPTLPVRSAARARAILMVFLN